MIVTNIEAFNFFNGPAALLESMRWNCNPQVGMKVTFWLSRNNSNVQEFPVLIKYEGNIKFYVVMVSNKRKDISLLA